MAWLHYDTVFGDQFELAIYKKPALTRKDLWEKFYKPFSDGVEEEMLLCLKDYLISLRPWEGI